MHNLKGKGNVNLTLPFQRSKGQLVWRKFEGLLKALPNKVKVNWLFM